MVKYGIYLIIIAALVMWFLRLKKIFMMGSSLYKKQGRAHKQHAERMVQCAYCHLYIPATEALKRADAVFCCEEHGRLFSA